MPLDPRPMCHRHTAGNAQDMTATIEIPLAGDYRIDLSRSTVRFTTRHVFGLARVRGTFQLREGHIHIADPLQGSSARATIAAASVNTRNPIRDAAVRSQYLGTDDYPDIAFVSTQLEEDDREWFLRGRLMVRGQTRPVDLTIDEVRPEGDRLRLKASCTVDRYEFGITKMKGMAGRRLTLTLDILADSSTQH
jgi:polyisoprenoid-binding protein YceI